MSNTSAASGTTARSSRTTSPGRTWRTVSQGGCRRWRRARTARRSCWCSARTGAPTSTAVCPWPGASPMRRGSSCACSNAIRTSTRPSRSSWAANSSRSRSTSSTRRIIATSRTGSSGPSWRTSRCARRSPRSSARPARASSPRSWGGHPLSRRRRPRSPSASATTTSFSAAAPSGPAGATPRCRKSRSCWRRRSARRQRIGHRTAAGSQSSLGRELARRRDLPPGSLHRTENEQRREPAAHLDGRVGGARFQPPGDGAEERRDGEGDTNGLGNAGGRAAALPEPPALLQDRFDIASHLRFESVAAPSRHQRAIESAVLRHVLEDAPHRAEDLVEEYFGSAAWAGWTDAARESVQHVRNESLQQLFLVPVMPVKRGAIDHRPLGKVVHADRGVPLFHDKFDHCRAYGALGAPDTQIAAALVLRHLRLVAAYAPS